MKHKYLILDFGKVIASPTTGHWDITPKFLELIDINSFDKEKFMEIRKKYSKILSEKITNLEEEYDMFLRFYGGILGEMNYSNEIIKQIAFDRTYKNEKYSLYNNIIEELEYLKDKYILILLSDSWPSVINFLKDNNIYNYFDRVYISSMYGYEKRDGILFDYVINDYNIKKNEALFIDDNIHNLDIAVSKGIDVLLMDRKNEINESKYKIINDLFL